MKCSKECPTKREKNNEAARKCRQKRKKFIETTLQEAKQAVEFNRFIRKELLSFYQSIRCPVPNSSMLFFESSAAAYLDLAIRNSKDSQLLKNAQANIRLSLYQKLLHHHRGTVFNTNESPKKLSTSTTTSCISSDSSESNEQINTTIPLLRGLGSNPLMYLLENGIPTRNGCWQLPETTTTEFDPNFKYRTIAS